MKSCGIPILRYGTDEREAHDGDAGEDDRNAQPEDGGQLKLAHGTQVTHNDVIVEALFRPVARHA